jgi:hypothetical protein
MAHERFRRIREIEEFGALHVYKDEVLPKLRS